MFQKVATDGIKAGLDNDGIIEEFKSSYVTSILKLRLNNLPDYPSLSKKFDRKRLRFPSENDKRSEGQMGEQTNQVQLKNFNRRTVLNYIRKMEPQPKRAGFGYRTYLYGNQKILEELEELQLIRCDEMEAGGMGRRAVTYAVNETYRYTVGIHINKFVTSIALLDLRGEILEIERYPCSRSSPNQSAFVEMLAASVENIIRRSGVGKEKVLGIGVGVPGPVDTGDRCNYDAAQYADAGTICL